MFKKQKARHHQPRKKCFHYWNIKLHIWHKSNIFVDNPENYDKQNAHHMTNNFNKAHFTAINRINHEWLCTPLVLPVCVIFPRIKFLTALIFLTTINSLTRQHIR